MPRKNIFITGSSGKIGRFLINDLLSKDYNIFALGLEKVAEGDNPRIRYIRGDLLEPGSYSSVLKEVETVVHMAAVTHTNRVSRYYAVNAEGTLGLLRLCRSAGVKRFIFISTRAISAQGGDYSRSKLIAEGYVRESGLDWIILRLAEVYGISSDKGLDLLLNRIQRLPIVPIVGNGEYTVNPVYISDVISCITEAIEKTGIKNKVYNIAGPESFTYNEFIDKLLALKRSKGIKLHLPLSLFRLFLRIWTLVMKDRFLVMDQLPRLTSEKSDDISLAMKDLSFRPARIEDMVSDR